MTVTSKESAEHYVWGDNCDAWHLVKTNSLSVIEEIVPTGCTEIRHYHNKSEQFFYVLSGKASLAVDGKNYSINNNQGLYIPAKTTHKLTNHENDELRFIVISVPPSHNDRIEVE
jgi:mannose-6-phosphate isomerase-like protein (cupin superfamily)